MSPSTSISTDISFPRVNNRDLVQVEVSNGAAALSSAEVETTISWTPANGMRLLDVLTQHNGYVTSNGDCQWASVPIPAGGTATYKLAMCRTSLGTPTVDAEAVDNVSGQSAPDSRVVRLSFDICRADGPELRISGEGRSKKRSKARKSKARKSKARRGKARKPARA